MKKILLLVAINLIGLPAYVFAGELTDEIIATECPLTPQVWELKSFPESSSTNNLRRKQGSPEFALGDFVTVEGRVVDSNCVPVEGAIVEIWQANALGINQYETTDYKKIDPNFLESGSILTDNLGHYSFLTIMPGATEVRAPHINFRITHDDFMPMETTMFFENQALNHKDPLLINEIDALQRHLLVAKGEKINKNSLEEGINYHFDITLEGKNKYLTY
jgi:protocatechuate 3,4-dioxygenase beta subunit